MINGKTTCLFQNVFLTDFTSKAVMPIDYHFNWSKEYRSLINKPKGNTSKHIYLRLENTMI